MIFDVISFVLGLILGLFFMLGSYRFVFDRLQKEYTKKSKSKNTSSLIKTYIELPKVQVVKYSSVLPSEQYDEFMNFIFATNVKSFFNDGTINFRDGSSVILTNGCYIVKDFDGNISIKFCDEKEFNLEYSEVK